MARTLAELLNSKAVLEAIAEVVAYESKATRALLRLCFGRKEEETSADTPVIVQAPDRGKG